jgi:ADP-ribose pyrophosphatase YjhB (NUDIX family)
MSSAVVQNNVVQRVRAILLTPNNTLLFIKRIKPHNPEAYWVAPGGGVECQDEDIESALRRELFEELGATLNVLCEAFVLRHEKAGKNLEEHFYVCRLIHYDLSLRNGPEFDDPTRGEYIPDEVPLNEIALSQLNIRTPELFNWLVANLRLLQVIARLD